MNTKSPNPQTLYWNVEQDRKTLATSLRRSEISITSTDTLYGFLGELSKESYKRICTLKKILSPARPFLVLTGSIDAAKQFTYCDTLPQGVTRLMQLCWPGPLTMIVPARDTLDPYLVSSKKTIALRVPNHNGLLALLGRFAGLFSTSANISGAAPPRTRAEISTTLLENVTYVVEEMHVSQTTIASTILDCSSPKRVELVREGAFPLKTLEEIYGAAIKDTQ